MRTLEIASVSQRAREFADKMATYCINVVIISQLAKWIKEVWQWGYHDELGALQILP